MAIFKSTFFGPKFSDLFRVLNLSPPVCSVNPLLQFAEDDATVPSLSLKI